ncbi:META domain-containing protein [uncultured Roseovarius sp.]|uniref:META domain-containing protein n=1 Tax=uncultured Roseovarius sp. TaxID=293344 RepID=UPI0026241921|nr:META domain-containing protein [uncultured Roseovarius sp.]
MRIFLAVLALLALVNCRGDETVAQYGGADIEWKLITLNGDPFPARATLQLGPDGKITGQASCNRYFGTQTAPYPWFSVKNVGATRLACPALDQETIYLTALSEMTLSEVAGDTLILSNDAGREMLFKAIQ